MRCWGCSRGFVAFLFFGLGFMEPKELNGPLMQKTAPSPGADLEDMQSLLYLLEEAKAHENAGKLNLALKRFLGVVKVSHRTATFHDPFINAK